MIKKIIHAFTMLIIAFCNAQTGNVGINTTTPTNKLHVKSTADPLRLEGIQQAGSIFESVLAQDANGVVKKLDIKSPASTNLVLNVVGNSTTTFPNNTFYYPNFGAATTDTYGGYHYGPNGDTDNYYTVQADGLYYIFNNITLVVNYSSYSTSSFNGNRGTFQMVTQINTYSIGREDTSIFGGANKNGSINEDNLYTIYNNATLWLKKGDKLFVCCYTFGKGNYSISGSSTYVDLSKSNILIYKLL